MAIDQIVMSPTWFQVPNPNKLLLYFGYDTRNVFYKQYRKELNRQLKARDIEINAKILLRHFAKEFSLESISVMPNDLLYLFSFPCDLNGYCSIQECCQSFGTTLYDFIRYFAGGCDDKFTPEVKIADIEFEKLYNLYMEKRKEIAVAILIQFLWRFRNKKRSYFYLDRFDL